MTEENGVRKKRKSYVHIYCGDGKGKTTAAMGLALRMAGSGGNVLVCQFFKNGASSEITALKEVCNVTVVSQEKSFGRFANMDDVARNEAKDYYPQYLERVVAMAPHYDLLVLDEVISAINHGFIDVERMLEIMRTEDFPELVLTGRRPDERLVLAADYVTKMEKVKHPFDMGVNARPGIEF